MFGTTLDLKFFVKSDLAAKNICVTTVLKYGGKASMPRFNRAIPGSGGVKMPLIGGDWSKYAVPKAS